MKILCKGISCTEQGFLLVLLLNYKNTKRSMGTHIKEGRKQEYIVIGKTLNENESCLPQPAFGGGET